MLIISENLRENRGKAKELPRIKAKKKKKKQLRNITTPFNKLTSIRRICYCIF